MPKKLKKCPKCGKSSFIWEEINQDPILKKLEKVLRNHKSPYEKKIALYNCLKDIEVGELEPIEKERINFLLQSKLYGELAKQSMKEYEKLTVKDYSQNKNKKY